jgi:hypothetical protein
MKMLWRYNERYKSSTHNFIPINKGVIYKLCGDMNPMESYCHATLGPKKW